jgi:hypothetical protein
MQDASKTKDTGLGTVPYITVEAAFGVLTPTAVCSIKHPGRRTTAEFRPRELPHTGDIPCPVVYRFASRQRRPNWTDLLFPPVQPLQSRARTTDTCSR